MKKIWISFAAIVVLIAVWLGTTWYTGQRIQAETGDIITRLNAAWTENKNKNPEAGKFNPQIKQISYERGLLSSHARFAVTSDLLPGQSLMEINLTVWHGPFPLAALRHGSLIPRKYLAHVELLATVGPLKMMVGAIMNGKPPLVVDAGCSYGGHCSGTGITPAIDVGLSDKAKLTFGGIQTQFDFDHNSDTDYKWQSSTQLLPLSISGQNFGSGQITVTSDAQSVSEQFSWKTDQGESKIAVAFNVTQPIPLVGFQSMDPDKVSKLLKTASLNVSLSKPMLVDLAARALNLTQGIDLAAARQEVEEKFGTLLTNPQAAQYLRAQGDLLVSNWQYGDGKLLINGQDTPELLERIKQSYLERLHDSQESDPAAGDDAADSTAGADAPAPNKSASASK